MRTSSFKGQLGTYLIVLHTDFIVLGYSSLGLKVDPFMKSLFPKPLTSIPDMFICIIDFLLQLKYCKSRKICSYCGLLSFDAVHNVYKVIKSGNEGWHAGVDRRGFGTKQDLITLFFYMHVQILWQSQKAVLTIVEFEFFGIFYSKFQSVSTSSICSNFCVENWLLCCDLICNEQHVGVDVRGFGNQLFIYTPISFLKMWPTHTQTTLINFDKN